MQIVSAAGTGTVSSPSTVLLGVTWEALYNFPAIPVQDFKPSLGQSATCIQTEPDVSSSLGA